MTYHLTDQVDSVRLVADGQGKPVTRTEYYPYGEAWFQEGNTHHAPKYNSQELDRESGLYFYNARYYDAGVGRFVTADNVIDGEFDTQGWNRYAYVKGNPVILKDPTGRASVVEINGKYYYKADKRAGNVMSALLSIAPFGSIADEAVDGALGITKIRSKFEKEEYGLGVLGNIFEKFKDSPLKPLGSLGKSAYGFGILLNAKNLIRSFNEIPLHEKVIEKFRILDNYDKDFIIKIAPLVENKTKEGIKDGAFQVDKNNGK